MGEPRAVTFFYDYVDPGSFLLEQRLRALGLEPGRGLHPLPFEVNPPPLPLLDPEDAAWRDRWTRCMEEARELGFALHRPSIVPWTRKAHELAFHAAHHDSVEEIHEAVFRAYLMDGRDIGRIDVLAEIAGANGLDEAEARAVLDVDRHRESLEGIRSRALREGVHRLPALYVDGRLLHGDATPEELEAFLHPGVDGREP
jgi:predicted DsbA family dithiol-disulfide isomerase